MVTLKVNSDCDELKKSYVNLIGKNSKPFDTILKKIEELNDDESLGQEERVNQLVSCYKKELNIAETKSTKQETIEEKLKQNQLFFDNEQLCLKYSRSRYNDVLKLALSKVYIKQKEDTTDYILESINEDNDDQFLKNYIDAQKTIFDNIWKEAKEKAKEKDSSSSVASKDIFEEAICFADSIVNNMSICVVLTENENDANKLFEVLNDRSLKVDDLELIKNHFYKEYCTKSNDNENVKDDQITKMDEIWTDKIFFGNSDFKNKLISYLATVYLTCDENLVYKDDTKYKDIIEKKYSKNYSCDNNPYTKECLLEDFNVYFAIKIILDKFNVTSRKLNEVSLRAEQDDKSITFKAFHLLNALNYVAVLPALTNIIIASYINNGKSLSNTNFEVDFKEYVTKLIDDKDNMVYANIHKTAYMLWIASMKAKDYTIPREIAKRIISNFGHKGYDSTFSFDFLGDETKNLNAQFEEWINRWRYGSSKNEDFIIKILFLHLLESQRLDCIDAYKASEVTINFGGTLAYRLDAAKLQLDHLEPEKYDSACPEKYYSTNDLEKRETDINSYLGNFMILDAVDNNCKNNFPLIAAIKKFYNKIEISWLIQDIKDMTNDPTYFDIKNKVPKEEFFKERSKRLKKYFQGFLNKDLSQENVTIVF